MVMDFHKIELADLSEQKTASVQEGCLHYSTFFNISKMNLITVLKVISALSQYVIVLTSY
jgi:hypothetical protein